MVTRNMQKVDRNRKQLSIQNIILYSCYDKIKYYIILLKRDIAFSSRSLTVITKIARRDISKTRNLSLGKRLFIASRSGNRNKIMRLYFQQTNN